MSGSVHERWLDYAVDVVASTDHDCTKDGGGCLEGGGESWMRWPGYLGSEFREGVGLLLVGNVHRDFTSNNVPLWVSELLVSTTKHLRADPENHRSQYFSEVQAAYHRGLAGDDDGGEPWKVARPFAYILRQLGMSWPEVAYTNASKSQHDSAPSKLITGCLSRWPLEELATRLDARAVITCSAPARESLANKGLAVHYFPQRYSYAKLDEIATAIL